MYPCEIDDPTSSEEEVEVDVPPSTAVNGKLIRLRHHCLRSGCNMYPCEIDDPTSSEEEVEVDVPPSTAVNGKLIRLRHHCPSSGCNMYPCEIDDPTLAPCGGCREAVGSVHQCIHCGSNIHPWCGVSTGEEGYGQSIICPNCIVAGK